MKWRGRKQENENPEHSGRNRGRRLDCVNHRFFSLALIIFFRG